MSMPKTSTTIYVHVYDSTRIVSHSPDAIHLMDEDGRVDLDIMFQNNAEARLILREMLRIMEENN